jgi:hypothetical protein
MTLTALPDLDTLDSDELKALVIQQHGLVIENQALVLEKKAELESQQDEIKRLTLWDCEAAADAVRSEFREVGAPY